MRNLVARNGVLEKENKRLRATLKASCTRRQKAVDAARRLHGILLANGLKVPR
jgi:hypothetical protein